jgi:hypothetical protein
MEKNVAQLIQKIAVIIEPPFHRGAIRAAKLNMNYSVFWRIAVGVSNKFNSISMGFAVPFSANMAAVGGV